VLEEKKRNQGDNNFEMVENVLYTSRDSTQAQQNESKEAEAYNQLNYYPEVNINTQIDGRDEYSHIEHCNNKTEDELKVYNELYFSKDFSERNNYDESIYQNEQTKINPPRENVERVQVNFQKNSNQTINSESATLPYNDNNVYSMPFK